MACLALFMYEAMVWGGSGDWSHRKDVTLSGDGGETGPSPEETEWSVGGTSSTGAAGVGAWAEVTVD